MNGCRASIGLFMLLVISVLSVQKASAETTAFACSKSVTNKTWSDAHCLNEGGFKQFGHKEFHVPTEITGAPGTTSEGVHRLKATVNGITTELATSGGVSGSGTAENAKFGELVAKGEGTLTYTGVTVAAPAGKGCRAYTNNGGVKGEEGVIHTNPLKAETNAEMGVKIVPATALSAIATFIIDGCTGSEALESLNQKYSLEGSVIGEPNGGEVKFTHAGVTSQGTLKFNGSIKAGYNGGISVKNNGTALAVTTCPCVSD
jgi:hypothetical protein